MRALMHEYKFVPKGITFFRQAWDSTVTSIYADHLGSFSIPSRSTREGVLTLSRRHSGTQLWSNAQGESIHRRGGSEASKVQLGGLMTGLYIVYRTVGRVIGLVRGEAGEESPA